MIDTVARADASVIIYSLAKTAKANEHLMIEIQKLMDDHDTSS